MNALATADNELVARLGWALVHSLWQGAFIAALAAAVLRQLRSANARYLAAWTALVLMIVCMAVTACVAAPNMDTAREPEIEFSEAALARPDRSQQRTHIARVAPQHSDDRDARSTLPQQRPIDGDGNAPADVDTNSGALAVGESQHAVDPKETVEMPLAQKGGESPDSRAAPASIIEAAMPWIVGVWMLGVSLLTVCHLGGFVKLQRCRRRGISPPPDDVAEMFARLLRKMGIARAVEVWQSNRIAVPSLIDGLRPVVLLPVSVLSGLTPEQLEAVLAHELAHLKRHDHWLNLVQIAAETLLFYHPAVWWMSRRVRLERENCCDDEAVRVCGKPMALAWALTKLAEVRGENKQPGLAAAATGPDRGSLLARICRIVGRSSGSPDVHRPWAHFLIGALLLAIPVTCLLTAADDQPAQIAGAAVAGGDNKLPPGAIARFGTSRFRHPHESPRGAEVVYLSFSKDGKSLVSATRDGLHFWDAAAGRRTRSMNHNGSKNMAFAVAADGETAVAVRYRSSEATRPKTAELTYALTLLNLRTERRQTTSVESDGRGIHDRAYSVDPQRQVAISPDGATIVISGEAFSHKGLWVFDAGSGRPVLKSKQQVGNIRFVDVIRFSPNGKAVALGTPEGLYLWDLTPGGARKVPGTKAVTAVEFVGSKHVVVADKGGVSRINTATGRTVPRYRSGGTYDDVQWIELSPDNRWLAYAAKSERSVRVHDVESGKAVHRFPIAAPRPAFPRLAFSPDSRTLAAAFGDAGVIRLWDLATGKVKAGHDGHDSAVEHVAFLPDGKSIAAAGKDDSIRTWNLERKNAGRVLESPQPARHPVSRDAVIVSPGGKHIARSECVDGIRLWNASTGKSGIRFQQHGDNWRDHALAFSADGSHLVSFGSAGRLRVWEINSRKLVFEQDLKGNVGFIKRCWLSRNGARLAVARNQTVDVYQTDPFQRLRTMKRSLYYSAAVAFSPDNRRLVIHDFGPTVTTPVPGGGQQSGPGKQALLEIVDVASGKTLHERKMSYRASGPVAFRGDGKMLAVASGELGQPLLLLDGQTLQQRGRLSGFDAVVTSLAYSPDGQQLVSGMSDTTVLVWQMPADQARSREPAKVQDVQLRVAILRRPVCVAVCQTLEKGQIEEFAGSRSLNVRQAMKVEQTLAGFKLKGPVGVHYTRELPDVTHVAGKRIICVLQPRFDGRFHAASFLADTSKTRGAIRQLAPERSKKDAAHVKHWVDTLSQKRIPGSFNFSIEFHGDNEDARALGSLLIRDYPGWDSRKYPAVMIDAAGRKKLIAHLAADGFFLKGLSDLGKEIPPPPKPSYTFRLIADGGKVSFVEVVGWGPPMVERLRGLRTALDGDAAKELDKLLAKLTKHLNDRQAHRAEMIKREIEWLRHPNEHTRRNAASNLAMFGADAKPAVDELIRALSDKSDAGLRMYAARALGTIGPDAAKAVPVLSRALADRTDFGSRFVRKEAAKALGKIGPQAAGGAVDDLLPLLGDDDLYVRRAASESLGLLGEKAVPALIRSLEDRNPEVRYRATAALARMRDTARAALEKALESDNVHVRRGAARAFASYYVMPQIKAAPKLIEHLQDKDAVVRRGVAAALVECFADSHQARTAILKELNDDDELAFEIVVLLSRTATRDKVLRELLKALDGQPPVVRAQVIRGVGLAGPSANKAIPLLKTALNDRPVGLRAAEALFRIASHEDEVRRQVDAFFKRHKLDGPYPGYRDDLRLSVRSMDYEGPGSNFSAPEAVAAARRIFANVNFVGKTKQEVLAILGDPKALSAYARARQAGAEGQLVYCYATGFKGTEYKLIFKDGRVQTVNGGGLY